MEYAVGCLVGGRRNGMYIGLNGAEEKFAFAEHVVI